MSFTIPTPVKLPTKILQDPELRKFFVDLTRSLYLLWEHSRKLETTTADTTITHTAPGKPDFAIQDLTTKIPFGFVTKDEGNSVLQVIENLQKRVIEIEAHFKG